MSSNTASIQTAQYPVQYLPEQWPIMVRLNPDAKTHVTLSWKKVKHRRFVEGNDITPFF